jgi:Protein of unknown function (DUF1580)
MAIEIANETLISFQEAPAFVPGRPHISTLHRWRLRGVRGVRLETVLIGGRRFTSREALQRFVAAVSASTGVDGTAPQAQCRIRPEYKRAAAALKRRGV